MTEPVKNLKNKKDRIIDPSFCIFTALALIMAALCFYYRGEDQFFDAIREGVELFLFVLPRMTAALLIAGFVLILVPRNAISKWVGGKSGLKGILISTVAGMITPGGPMMAWPMVVALYRAGAHRGALVAYVTSWALLGMQRIIVWEIPLMGTDFTFIRFISSVPMPVIAGLLAMRLPINIDSGLEKED